MAAWLRPVTSPSDRVSGIREGVLSVPEFVGGDVLDLVLLAHGRPLVDTRGEASRSLLSPTRRSQAIPATLKMDIVACAVVTQPAEPGIVVTTPRLVSCPRSSATCVRRCQT